MRWRYLKWWARYRGRYRINFRHGFAHYRRISNAGLWWFLCWYPEQVVKQMIELRWFETLGCSRDTTMSFAEAEGSILYLSSVGTVFFWGKKHFWFFISSAPITRTCCTRVTVTNCASMKRGLSLTHWGRDEMNNISQTTFSNVFSSMKMFEFRLKFHWSLFPRIQLTIFHHWFR